MNLLFLGGSNTDCRHSFDPENLGYGYVGMIARRLKPAVPHLQVSNKGIDGFTASRVKGMWQSLPEEGKERYDLVTVLAGINDLGMWMEKSLLRNTPEESLDLFARTFQELITDILDYGIPRLILMEPFLFPVPARYRLWLPWLSRMSGRIRNLAEYYGLSFIPLQQRLNGEAEKLGYGRITPDGIHLTEEGHRILADAWMEEAGI